VKKSLYYRIAIFILLVAAASYSGCSKGDAGSTLDELQFSVNDSLVAQPVSDAQLGISFRPPRGWVRVEQRLIDSARAIAEQKMGQNFDRNETARAIYVDSASKSSLAIMQLDSFDVSDSSRSIKEYVQKLRAADPDLQIETALFKKGDYRVHQVRVVSLNSVTLRMIFDNLTKRAPVFAFNSTLPRDSFSTKARAIESSVGSLQPQSSIP
jgi:hypothetical protein